MSNLLRTTASGSKRPATTTESQIELIVSALVFAVNVQHVCWALPNIVIVNLNARGRSSQHLMMISTEVAAAAAAEGISH